MYFPFFVAYMVVGFAVCLGVFFWALTRGQFRDQQRARYLALEAGGPSTPVRLTRRARVETLTLFLLVCCGLSGSVAVIVYILTHGR
jgi:hypothetical protein